MSGLPRPWLVLKPRKKCKPPSVMHCMHCDLQFYECSQASPASFWFVEQRLRFEILDRHTSAKRSRRKTQNQKSGPGSREHSCVLLLESLVLPPWLTNRICKLSPHLCKDCWGHCTYCVHLLNSRLLNCLDLYLLYLSIANMCKW